MDSICYDAWHMVTASYFPSSLPISNDRSPRSQSGLLSDSDSSAFLDIGMGLPLGFF